MFGSSVSGSLSSAVSGAVGGKLGDALGGIVGGLLSGEDDMNTSPIPSFYFEVLMFDKPKLGVSLDLSALDSLGVAGDVAKGLVKEATSMVQGAIDSFLAIPAPGDYHLDQSFIEVSGIEMQIDSITKAEGGYNYPIDLPGQLKNPHVILKRLVRMKTLKDKWSLWVSQTMERAALWNKAIETKHVQINIMHPNLSDSGSPIILKSIMLYDAYPVKTSFSTLNSTSEDFLVEEIEISYSNTYSGYGMTNQSNTASISL